MTENAILRSDRLTNEEARTLAAEFIRRNVRTPEERAAFKKLQEFVGRLDPCSNQHLAKFPYGIATSRDIMFGLSLGDKHHIEPEEMYDCLFDRSFMTDYYEGEYKWLNDMFRASLYNGISEYDNPEDSKKYELSYISHRNYLVSAALSRAFNRYQIVYKPDPDFLDHLIDIKEFEFSPAIFRFLPESAFYIDLSSYNKVNIEGLFVSVKTEDDLIYIMANSCDKDMVDTDNPLDFVEGDSGTFHHCITSILDVTETVSFSAWVASPGITAVTVPRRKTKDLLKNLPLLTKEEKETLVFVTDEEHFNDEVKIRQILIKLLTYLTCKNPDLRFDKQLKQELGRLERLNKEIPPIPEKWDVGARFGSVIREEDKKKRISGTSETEKTGKSKRPHVRSSHFHTYWTGPGREIPRIEFISTIIVNGTKKDIIPRIHRVTDVEPKGSAGEEIIKNYLVAHDIPFDREYYIKDIHARYDFRITLNRKKLMIEFDGEQHFRSIQNWGGRPEYEKRKKADAKKTDYCRNNGIPLLRIRFDQKPVIEKLISEFINNPDPDTLNNTLSDEEYYSIRKD